MNWILIAFLAPLLWAISTFIDKVLISRYFKGKAGALIIYSCLVGLPVLLLILLFKPDVLNIDWKTALFVMINGLFFIVYLFPYFKALDEDDASRVVPIFQIIPVFTYILAFFILGENLLLIQIIAGILIITGAVGISSNFGKNGFRIKKKVLFLMLLACLLIAINSVLFKFFSIELNFWQVSFWQYSGFFLFGIFFLAFIKKYRQDFINSFKENGPSIIGLNVLNETINIIGIIMFSYAILLAPVALVGLINGFQPLIVLLLGVIFTLIIPKFIKENISKKMILQKVIFIIIMIIGASLL